MEDLTVSYNSATISDDPIDSSALPVMEEFFSIQGEGHHTGIPASFIRLAGCDVGCVWCDVKESWEMEAYPRRPVKDILNTVMNDSSGTVIITGGEPALHDLSKLTGSLRNSGIKIHLETSGTRELKGQFDWITVSPKKFKAPLDQVLKAADELKIVVYNRTDLAWALSFLSKLKQDCLLYLQPEYSRRDKMTPLILDFIDKNPEWKISIQTHKTLGVK